MWLLKPGEIEMVDLEAFRKAASDMWLLFTGDC